MFLRVLMHTPVIKSIGNWGCGCRRLWTAGLEIHVKRLLRKHESLSQAICDPEVLNSAGFNDLYRELSQLKPVVNGYHKLLEKQKDMIEVTELIRNDNSFSAEVQHEMQLFRSEIEDLRSHLIDLLIPNDDENVSGAVVELRAGTGGQEAAYFASEVLNMYECYATFRHWTFEVLDRGKDATVSVTGNGVFDALKNEAGVHRVQRVPVTDSHGRIHTSTITVAVLPQPDQIDATVNAKDLKVETFRSSGPGGQHVNKTDSAVRMTHLPSGIVVSVQEDRSQLKNRANALKLIAAKLYNRDRMAAASQRSEERRSQIGTGERHERIRTYNYMQDRITDHRAELTLPGLHTILEGQEAFHDLVKEISKRNRLKSILQFTHP